MDDQLYKYMAYTYRNIEKVKNWLGNENTGIGRATTAEYLFEPLNEKQINELKDLMPDLEVKPSTVDGCVQCVEFLGVVYNPPLLTNNMITKMKELGVTVTRKRIEALLDVFGAHTKAVFNCSGLGALSLAKDSDVYLTRGQVVVVRAPHIKRVTLSWGDTDSTYIIPRPESKTHEVILGGFYQPHVLDATTYGHETEDILSRVTSMCPELLLENPYGNRIEDLQIMRVVAGARPSRTGGARVEKEQTVHGTVLHNYGAGGCGYLSGLGMAHESVNQL